MIKAVKKVKLKNKYLPKNKLHLPREREYVMISKVNNSGRNLMNYRVKMFLARYNPFRFILEMLKSPEQKKMEKAQANAIREKLKKAILEEDFGVGFGIFEKEEPKSND
jgi:hypothetical protein